ncbi:TetR/AcrR family transcriptional regulator [Xenorhabdus bovienii]|uniref:TetR/AcrR family transcriptional regulator n=1 Tax=Xenorhabdus aichiensis TaxID=3025874 RepID=A0ABT5M3L8_9GAMM|nr:MULTISPECIES: TetR/AcrR family transcriptional regulator [Xenorhabdus]MDC9621565.1 TetR/AcrR family transcriptional regulator [Xenorhabdus aichiensis]MDE9516619.1 TetR/AcrR family transcriptional regulator [Xenorhabdus bovienii]
MSKQTEKQRAKRKQIIDAAISCFIEKGFHATSTAEICKAAGMSPGNLFHYYPTKNAIIEAIAEEDSHDYNEILHTNDDESSVMATIEKMMTSLIHLYNQPDYARLSIEIIAEASRNPTINKIFIENEKKVRERLALLIRKGIETGEIDKQINAEQTASWLMITAGGAIGRELVEPNFKWLESMGSFTYMIRKIFAS